MLTHVAGCPSSIAPTTSAITRSTAAMTANDAMKPNANASPFARACGVPSNRTTAMIVAGLIAAASASGRILPSACPISRRARRRPS